MHYDKIFMITCICDYLLLPQILVIPSFEVLDFSPLITFLIFFLFLNEKKVFHMESYTELQDARTFNSTR